MSWQSKFDYDDVVRVRDDGPQEARPGAKAWIVGVEVARQGTYYTQFLPGVVYTIEFEDGAVVDVHESHLELFPGVEVRPVKRWELVTSHFGYWPAFCDAKIRRFAFDAEGVITLSLFYIDNDAGRSAEVAFRFAGATDVKLDHLLSDNVVDELTIPKDLAAPVHIESAYGLEGSFLCESIEVTEVTKG